MPTKVFSLDIRMLSCITEKSFAPTSNRLAMHEDCRGHRQSFASCNTHIRVEGNISAYLADNEPSNDEGRVAVYRLLLQGVEVDVDNLSTRRCTDSLDGLTGGGGCLVALVSCILQANNRVIVAVL